jgi:hypothetical protein
MLLLLQWMPGIKRPVPGSVHLPASNADVKNEWSYVFCPVYAVISCTVTTYFTTATITTGAAAAASLLLFHQNSQTGFGAYHLSLRVVNADSLP